MKGFYLYTHTHTQRQKWENLFLFGRIYMIKFCATVIHLLDMDVLVNYRKLELKLLDDKESLMGQLVMTFIWKIL